MVCLNVLIAKDYRFHGTGARDEVINGEPLPSNHQSHAKSCTISLRGRMAG
jgi:hypothetical protein